MLRSHTVYTWLSGPKARTGRCLYYCSPWQLDAPSRLGPTPALQSCWSAFVSIELNFRPALVECSSGSQGTCPLSPRDGVSWRTEDRVAPSFLHSSRQSSWITASLRTNSALVLVKEAECRGWYQIPSLLPALHNLGLYLKLFLFLLVFYWKYSFIQSILITVSPLPSPPRPFPPPHPPNSVPFFSLSIENRQEKKNLGFCCFLLETSFLFHLWNRVGR